MKLYLASGNAHKVQEFQALADASGRGIEIISAKSVGGMPNVVEDTGTFIGNATKKARALRAILPPEAWVLADDSGLCVDALGGAPGVESAYYAGPQGDSAANLAKLVTTMRDVPDDRRGAHFVCVLVLIDGAGQERVFEGRCDGHLLREPRGGSGFGYDPLFVPTDHEKSLAEIDEASKNQLSHRGRATSHLLGWIRSLPRTA
jgi:XTP/dITP diphosphohydrolase